MRNSILLSALLVLIFSTTNSQELLTLSDAIRKGLEQNYGIQINSLTTEIAKNSNNWGNAGIMPHIGLSAGQNLSKSDIETETNINFNGFDSTAVVSAVTTNNSFSPALSLNWVLFNGFNAKITKEKLEEFQKLSEGNLAIIVENTIQAIYLGYYLVLLEQEKLNVLQDVMKLSLDRYHYVQEKKNLGGASTYDVLQAQNAYLADSSNFLLQKMNLKNVYRNLNLLLAENIDKNYILADELTAINQDYNFDDLLSQLKTNNKNLKNQYINQEILKKEVNQAKSSLYPVLSFNGSASYPLSGTSISDNIGSTDLMRTPNTFSYAANFSLSLNLYNGQRTQKAIQNAKIEESIGVLSLEEMQLKLTVLLANMLDLFNVRKQLYQLSLESIEAASLSLQISGEKYKSGAINSFNYRDVQLMYVNTAFAQLQATYNLLESHSELMRLTGNMITEY